MAEELYQMLPDEIIWRIVDNEAVILNINTGFYFTLNGTGTDVWLELTKNMPVSSIIPMLSEKYGVTVEIIEKDISDILNDLCAAQLIRAN